MGCEDDNITCHEAWRVSLDHRKLKFVIYIIILDLKLMKIDMKKFIINALNWV